MCQLVPHTVACRWHVVDGNRGHETDQAVSYFATRDGKPKASPRLCLELATLESPLQPRIPPEGASWPFEADGLVV